MDTGAVLALALAALGVGGPLLVLLKGRRAPVPRDWSGRESGSATPGHDGLG